YGHPDHVKSHQVGVAAFDAAGDARPSKLYFVRFPLTWTRDFVRSLRDAGIPAPRAAPVGTDVGPEDVEIGTPDDLVTTSIDVQRYVSVKQAALACHRSQMPPEHFLRRMPPALAERLWAHEFYSRQVGPTDARDDGLETDLFAGLTES